jgi:copper(I)-binding protein
VELIEEAVKVTRLNRRLLLGAIAVLVPVLAGCEAGLNAPTLEFHPASNGVSITQNGITLDNVFVLGPPLGSALPPGGRAGVFLSIEAENGDRLISVSAPGTASAVKLTGGPVDLPAQTLVDLSGPEPKMVLTRLANPLFGGQTVQLTLLFQQAGAVTLTVPVEPHAYEYATYAPPPIPKPVVKPKAHPSGSASAGASASGSATSSPSPSPSATP